MTSDSFEFGNHPQLLIPGASRSEVRTLAEGSARAKGWNIVRSTDDLLVMQRPIDPASPSARAGGATGSTIPPVVEVTSAFAEQSGGVNVGLGAVLIAQPPGENSPKRIDYTENYRPTLTRSLESLRATWAKEHQRLARSAPGEPTRAEQPAATVPNPGNAAANASPPAPAPQDQALGQSAAAAPAVNPGTITAASTPSPTTAGASPAEPRVNPAPPAPVATPARDQAATSPPPAAIPPLAAPPVAPSAAAITPTPVVNSSVPPTVRVLPVQPNPEPVAPKDNLVTLGQSNGTGVWAYYAEQYARLRGCNVSDDGARLIETRPDGEIHKVSCVGSASFLLKCDNGVCRGLN